MTQFETLGNHDSYLAHSFCKVFLFCMLGLQEGNKGADKYTHTHKHKHTTHTVAVTIELLYFAVKRAFLMKNKYFGSVCCGCLLRLRYGCKGQTVNVAHPTVLDVEVILGFHVIENVKQYSN